jgi:hypothetical protein
MSRLTDPEESQNEEYDLDYTKELGDDLPGATPTKPRRILLDML